MIRGRLTATLATSDQDKAAALTLRRLCFRTTRGLPPEGEGDRFDAISDHLIIRANGETLATFRTHLLPPGDFTQSYSAQFYDLTHLPPAPMLELGRFCLHPAQPDPDILRLAFAALTHLVDQSAAAALIGCTSFDGTDMSPYQRALTAQRPQWRDIAATAPETIPLATLVPTAIQRPLPPLLRHYLSLGGTLSDHAVIDRTLQTCHVFTALAVAAIPPSRARALRDLAAG